MKATCQLASLTLCVVALSSCDIVHIAAQTAQARGEFQRTLTVNGPVHLSVRTGSGSIQVRTGAADRVQIIGRISASSWRDGLDPAARVTRVESAPPITQTGNAISLGDTRNDPLYRNVGISYELIVPVNTRLTAQSGSGHQTIGSIDGEVRAQTGSGSIRVERAGGSLHAQTGSGHIEADAVGGEVRAETGSGSVDIRQIVRADVSVQTGSGSVSLDLPPDAAYTLDAQTGSGSITTADPIAVEGRIRRNHVTGTVRGGGNSVRIRTGSGSIAIR